MPHGYYDNGDPLECYKCEEILSTRYPSDALLCQSCDAVLCDECAGPSCVICAKDFDVDHADVIYCPDCVKTHWCKNCLHKRSNGCYCFRHLKAHQKQCRPRTSADRCVDVCNEAIQEKEEDIEKLEKSLKRARNSLKQLKKELGLAQTLALKTPASKKQKVVNVNPMSLVLPEAAYEDPELSKILNRVDKLRYDCR